MLNTPETLPSDPAELRRTAEGLVQLVKSQALKIAKLEHQLAGHRRQRFGSKSETMDQLQLRRLPSATRTMSPSTGATA